MPLSTGDKLGPYEIVSPIGEGGMGEVYKARDTRLERSVAIKVLPEHIAKREDLRARFEREARAVASLNHPNICVVHDIGSQDGHGYMVMEYMEGETLAARIAKGALPLDQALKYGAQIADALDRAHRAGVTHRDVKPANIMLTRDGVKVLDFGLAKSAASQKPGPDDATLVAGLTTEGTILGTPQYMAPEQFEGKEADARADIWAFGAVLYEMVTGQKAFQGKNYSSLIASILAAEPPPMSVAPFTPAWLERLVRRCLAKDPEDRYYSMHDVSLDLRTQPTEIAIPTTQSHRSPWVVTAVACMATTATLAWFAFTRATTSPASLARFDLVPPAGRSFAPLHNTGGSAISPDGKTLSFFAVDSKGTSLLYVRPLESLEARALPGTEEGGRPFWSPDSKSIAFVAGGKLKRIELSGGGPIVLCDAPAPRGGSWNEDGVILFGDRKLGLQQIPATGGTPSIVTKINKAAGETSHYYPQFLPGGDQFLYLIRNGESSKAGIFIGSLDGKPAQKIIQSNYNALYDAATQRLLYVQTSGTLMARKLNLKEAKLIGDPVTVMEGVRSIVNNGYTEFSISQNRIMFYARGRDVTGARFAWRDRSGKLLEKIGLPFQSRNGFHLSPSDVQVAYGAGDVPDVWVMDLARGLSTRVSFSSGREPRWSDDGKSLYFTNPGGIHRKAADGSGEEQLVGNKESPDFVHSVSPDGKYLLFGVDGIFILPLFGDKKPERYSKTKFSESRGVFSPDGRWVAYDSDESGRREVYIQGFPERRGKWLVSSEGGRNASWRADGKELYWVRPDEVLIAAGVELQASGVKVGRQEPVFRMPLATSFPYYQPAHDGQRFLVLEPEGEDLPDLPMVVVQHWAAGISK